LEVLTTRNLSVEAVSVRTRMDSGRVDVQFLTTGLGVVAHMLTALSQSPAPLREGEENQPQSLVVPSVQICELRARSNKSQLLTAELYSLGRLSSCLLCVLGAAAGCSFVTCGSGRFPLILLVRLFVSLVEVNVPQMCWKVGSGTNRAQKSGLKGEN
jgi:hypothetical protein